MFFFGLGSPPKKNRQKKPSLSTSGIMGCTQLPRTNYLPLRIATIPEQRNILPRKTRVSLKDDGFFQTGPFLLWPGHFSCIFRVVYKDNIPWSLESTNLRNLKNGDDLQEILRNDRLEICLNRITCCFFCCLKSVRYTEVWTKQRGFTGCLWNSKTGCIFEKCFWTCLISFTDNSFWIWLVIPHQFPQRGWSLAQMHIYIYILMYICIFVYVFFTRANLYTYKFP